MNRTASTKRRSLLPLLAALLVTLAAAAGLPPFAAAQDTTHVPVVINIYPNAGITEEDAKKAVEEASKHLAQAGVKLVPVKVNNPPAGNGGDDGSGGGTAGDGDLTDAEALKAVEFGEGEVGKLAGGRGLKVSFVRNPEAGLPANPARTIHRRGTLLVKKRANNQQTGETIAHEIGHILTLGPGHVIGPGTRADGGGHSADNGNLMAPSNRRTGTGLTDEQKEEIRRRRGHHGWCSAQFERLFPATKCASGSGGATKGGGGDLAGLAAAAVPPEFDLRGAWVWVLGGETLAGADVEAQITVAAAPWPGEAVNAVYSLGFDVDADAATGIVHAGLPGIDRIVFVFAAGTASYEGFEAGGHVLDTTTGEVQPLPPGAATILVDERFPDLDGKVVPASLSTLLAIPSELIPFAAPAVPVVAVAGPDEGGLDSLTLVLDLLASEKLPTLSTFGDGVPIPGGDYKLSIAGLTPGAVFDLVLDDQPLLTAKADADGAFAGSIILPEDLSSDVAHFLTAQDSTGLFAYSMTCPEWADVRLREGGVAVGGKIHLAIGGSPLTIATVRGEPAGAVAGRIGSLLADHPEVVERGAIVEVLGHRVVAGGLVESVVINDPGLIPGPRPRPRDVEIER